jgi:hypothetical protein
MPQAKLGGLSLMLQVLADRVRAFTRLSEREGRLIAFGSDRDAISNLRFTSMPPTRPKSVRGSGHASTC